MKYDIIWEDYPDHYSEVFYLTLMEIIDLTIPPLFQVHQAENVTELKEKLRGLDVGEHVIAHGNIIIRRS